MKEIELSKLDMTLYYDKLKMNTVKSRATTKT